MSTKYSALSPAINSLQAGGQVSENDQTALFEEKFGTMAYQALTSKFPDLVGSVVTFKMLDSDIQLGSAVGAFILEHDGEFIYVPVLLADNQLKPLDLMYAKSKDIFLPLDSEWLEELSKGALGELGEGTKLPETVATDVDIRNLVVPPTTGRYSYAAEASEPLGRRLTKEADELSTFNPQVWGSFVDMFTKVYGSSPGQALDQGTMDIEQMSKMYKGHMKTWSMPGSPGNAEELAAGTLPPAPVPQMGAGQPPMGQPSMGQPPMGQPPAAPGMTRTAAAIPLPARTIEQFIGDVKRPIISGAVSGAALGGAYGLSEQPIEKIPGSIARGALGGAIGGSIGHGLGGAAGRIHPEMLSAERGAQLGGLLGTGTGALMAAPSEPTHVLSNMIPQSMQPQYTQLPPEAYMSRMASDLRGMFAKLEKVAQHRNQLLDFLIAAPPAVKTAFITILEKNPQLLKTAADLYGAPTLLDALKSKIAGQVTSGGGGLYIANDKDKAEDLFNMFGASAPEAFRGILLRGYHFKDTRPKLNLAAHIQEYHDFHDPRESGVYLLYRLEKEPVPALVIPAPLDLLTEDRPFFPKDKSKVTRVQTRTPRGETGEPDSVHFPGPDVTRSHVLERLVILGNGDYFHTEALLGEQVTELLLKDSPIFKQLMSDGKASPAKGTGVFAARHGIHYLSTRPVEISELRVSTDKVVTGKITSAGGYSSKKFIMDPRSPINRVVRPAGADYVIIPASWKWIPLNKEADASKFISNPALLSIAVLDKLNSLGNTPIVATRAGESVYSVSGGPTLDKVSAMRDIAEKHYVHVSAAEAMLKIADVDGVCRVSVVSPETYVQAKNLVKTADGTLAPQTLMGAPPAMAAPPPAAPPPAAAPPAAASSPIDQAFSQTVEELEQQVSNLQAQLGVLATVQQRAQALGGGQPPTPAAPEAPAGTEAPPSAPPAEMQGPPPGMNPEQGSDPNAPAQEAPPPAVMRSESPSSQEIAQQVNPQFLNSAAQFSDMGAFDAGAIGSLAKDPSLKNLGSQYAAGLESSLDDLGRTLLTLYMQESALKDKIGEDTFVRLETQLRDTFHGLGSLLLNLTQTSTHLGDDDSNTV